MRRLSISFRHPGYIWLAGVSAFCIICTFFYVQYLLKPQLALKEELDNRLQVETARVRVVEKFSADHPDTFGYLQELDKEIVRVNSLLPEKLDLGGVISFLEKTAVDTSTVVGAFATDKSVYNQGGWTETRMTFKVGGNYADLFEFAKRIDHGSRLMIVEAVEFEKRVFLSKQPVDRKKLADALNRDALSGAGFLLTPILDRNLLSKPSLIIMKVSMIVVTKGQLTGAEAPPAQPKTPAAVIVK